MSSVFYHCINTVFIIITTLMSWSVCSRQCDFLNSEAQSPNTFSPSSLRVAACDLQQLMATFSHVYETNLGTYCGRERPSFSKEADVFQRVHQLLLACNTVLSFTKNLCQHESDLWGQVILRLSTAFVFRSWTC